MRTPSDEPNLVVGRRRAKDQESGSLADSRRRLGGHSRARQFLVADNSVAVAAEGVWRGLVSALQRHSVETALVEMSPEDKEVLTLAYIHGLTNSQIAARLTVSASTARRRLSLALARLEERARRSGAWISSIATGTFLHIVEQGARVVRVAAGIRPGDWSTGLAGALTVAAVAAVGVSVLVVNHHPSTVDRPAAPATAQIAALPNALEQLAKQPAALPANPVKTDVAAGPKSSDGNVVSAPSPQDPVEGCHGNPTSAPPTVPVGPRAGHPSGAPVTHPSAGGCG